MRDAAFDKAIPLGAKHACVDFVRFFLCEASFRILLEVLHVEAGLLLNEPIHC